MSRSYGYFYQHHTLDPRFPVQLSRYRMRDKAITALHSHNVLEVGRCISGAGLFLVGPKTMHFHEGDMSFVTEGEVHLARSVQGTTAEWEFVFIDPWSLLSPLVDRSSIPDPRTLSGPSFANILSAAERPELCGTVQQIAQELESRGALYQQVVRSLVLTLLTRLQRLRPPDPDTVSVELRAHAQRLNPAIEYMSGHYGDEIDLPTLARSCSMSPRNFTRLFTRSFGRSPLRYLNDLRVSMACSRLHDKGISIGRIALECGFTTQTSFNRQFKASTGVTPRQWRSR
jgi:AraC-like DNA-binding protein/quercetin dioxygenase-like cupin family protein